MNGHVFLGHTDQTGADREQRDGADHEQVRIVAEGPNRCPDQRVERPGRAHDADHAADQEHEEDDAGGLLEPLRDGGEQCVPRQPRDLLLSLGGRLVAVRHEHFVVALGRLLPRLDRCLRRRGARSDPRRDQRARAGLDVRARVLCLDLLGRVLRWRTDLPVAHRPGRDFEHRSYLLDAQVARLAGGGELDVELGVGVRLALVGFRLAQESARSEGVGQQLRDDDQPDE